MIQTWVTYEVVKVLFLYGLNPKPNSNIGHIAPQLQTYIQHINEPSDKTYDTAKTVQETLFKKTLHSSYFARCSFSDVGRLLAWRDDVKFMIPFLIMTWLRQLQQYFREKNNLVSWSKLGNYIPIDTVLRGEGKDPLALVYLTKPTEPTEPSVKVKQYADIVPDETYHGNTRKFIIKLLEMWAMMILQTPVEKKLEQTARVDKETKARYETCKKLNQSNYQFRLSTTNFAVTKRKQNRIRDIRLEPNLDYTKKSSYELHSVINNGLIHTRQTVTKLEHKTNATSDDMALVRHLKSMQQAYIVLANKTFHTETEGKTLEDLENIKHHLDSKLHEGGNDNDENDDDN